MNPVYGIPLNQTIITYQDIISDLSDQIVSKMLLISIIFLSYALWNILILRETPLIKIEEKVENTITDLLDYLCLVSSLYFIVLYILYI